MTKQLLANRINITSSTQVGATIYSWKTAWLFISYTRGVQPFAIARRITFIYVKYGRQWVAVIFMRYVYSKNRFYPVYVIYLCLNV